MNGTHISRLKPDALSRVLEALRTVGVAGNESDRPFDAHDIEQQLRETGYVGGSLSTGVLVRPHDGVDILVYDSNRYEGLPQAEEAWEEDYKRRARQRVESRVADWLERLRDLRSQMARWVEETPELSSLTLFDLPPVTMSEDLMRRFGVKSAHMPVFELRDAAQRVMRFQPKGLWVIGANGRVDLITKTAAPILFDRAEPGAGPSDWQLYYSKNGNGSVPLNKESFMELVRSGLQ